MKLSLLRKRYIELENEMKNLTEMINQEVNYSSSNKNYEATSTIQKIDEFTSPLYQPFVSVNSWKEQGKASREPRGGEINILNEFNQYSCYPYYFSDPNNVPYYRVAPGETVTDEMLRNKVNEATELLITNESNGKTLALPNLNRCKVYCNRVPIPVPRRNIDNLNKLENKTQNFEETRSSYYKGAPIPIPRQKLQGLIKPEMQRSILDEDETKQEECKYLNVLPYTPQRGKEISSYDDFYTLREDDPYYSSVPMMGLLMDNELKKLQREATMLSEKEELVVKDNKQQRNSPQVSRKNDEQKEKQVEKSQTENEYVKARLQQTLAECASFETSLQQERHELEKKNGPIKYCRGTSGECPASLDFEIL